MTMAIKHPLAITMWDFSWIERRWPGAGYEDWDQVLDELQERGYDAVRIDAFPHLIAVDPDRPWTLKPEWSVQDWGSPALNTIHHLKDHLIEFISKCAQRNIYVALSTWFREDLENHRMNIHSPEDMATRWIRTLDHVADAGLLDHILYVDLCNEFPLSCWAPFLAPALGKPVGTEVRRNTPEGNAWMKTSIDLVRAKYPQLRYCYSITSEYDTLATEDVSFMDLLEPHIWMAQASDFYDRVGYHYERFSMTGYENLVASAEQLYRSNPAHWIGCLEQQIQQIAKWSIASQKPLVTTECWGVVDYKD